jgi:hypothetical protein
MNELKKWDSPAIKKVIKLVQEWFASWFDMTLLHHRE